MSEESAVSVQQKALLEVLLEKRSDTFKAKVWEIVYQHGVDADDPNLQILIATGQLEVLLEQAPQEFEDVFKKMLVDLREFAQEQQESLCQRLEAAKQMEDERQQSSSKQVQLLTQVIKDTEQAVKRQVQAVQRTAEQERKKDKEYLKTLKETSVKVYEKEVAKGVQEIIQQAQHLKGRSWAMQVALPSAIAALILTGLGVGVGWTLHRAAMGALDPSGPRQLSLRQGELLQWAVSEEGQLSRHLLEWNQQNLSDCIAGQGIGGESLDVVGYGNRPIKYGICAMWVVPPEQRQFGNPQ
jgi:hypothetical protein